MSFADQIRQKTEIARQTIEVAERQKLEAAQKGISDAPNVLRKKTERLATSRYNYVSQLIQGAAANGLDFLEYPSVWTEVDDKEQDFIYNQIAECLQSEGFSVKQCSQLHPFNPQKRILLTIRW